MFNFFEEYICNYINGYLKLYIIQNSNFSINKYLMKAMWNDFSCIIISYKGKILSYIPTHLSLDGVGYGSGSKAEPHRSHPNGCNSGGGGVVMAFRAQILLQFVAD